MEYEYQELLDFTIDCIKDHADPDGWVDIGFLQSKVLGEITVTQASRARERLISSRNAQVEESLSEKTIRGKNHIFTKIDQRLQLERSPCFNKVRLNQETSSVKVPTYKEVALLLDAAASKLGTTISEAAQKSGITRGAIINRVRNGWELNEALTGGKQTRNVEDRDRIISCFPTEWISYDEARDIIIANVDKAILLTICEDRVEIEIKHAKKNRRERKFNTLSEDDKIRKGASYFLHKMTSNRLERKDQQVRRKD